MLEIVAGLTKKTPLVTLQNIRSTVANRVFLTKKAEHDFGFLSDVDIQKAINEVIDWYISNNRI